jgi:hypothetical protein
MLWILLLVGGLGTIIMLAFFIIARFSSNRVWYDLRSYLKKMVILIVVGLVGLLGFAVINGLSYDEISQTGNWNLVPIKYNSDEYSDGLFYVYVSGNANEIYSFYYQANDDGDWIKRGEVEIDTATIYENDDCIPHVAEYITYTKNKMNSSLRNILAFGYGESIQKTYEIYIPTGTILRTFDLDSQ